MSKRRKEPNLDQQNIYLIPFKIAFLELNHWCDFGLIPVTFNIAPSQTSMVDPSLDLPFIKNLTNFSD